MPSGSLSRSAKAEVGERRRAVYVKNLPLPPKGWEGMGWYEQQIRDLCRSGPLARHAERVRASVDAKVCANSLSLPPKGWGGMGWGG